MPATSTITSMSPESAISGNRSAAAGDAVEANAYYDQGNACQKAENFERAVAFYQKALAIAPGFVNAYNNMGLAFSKMSRLWRAADCYLTAIRMHPDFADAYNNLGNVFSASGSNQKAIACYQKAVELKENFAHAYYNLANAYEAGGRIEQAAWCLKKAQNILPQDSRINFGLGMVLQKQGQYYPGLQYLEIARDLDPEFNVAGFNFLLSLPMFYECETEISNCRKRFEKGLDEIVETIQLKTAAQRKGAVAAIGSLTNFYLAYQGQNDLELQKKFGNLVCRIMASRYPQWTTSLERPMRTKGEKLRIGFVSAYLHSHTVAKLFLGWIKNLNSEEFDIHCYSLKNRSDHVTEEFKRQSDRFCHLAGGLEPAARQIAEHRLHILVYLDIGMYAPATQLAGLRLAPVQCTAWGHPATTGLPTMDYFISSDLMEPEKGHEHYSEKLIRLSNISICYQPPVLPQAPKTRKQLGIEEDSFVYLSPQSLFKYLPQFDFIYPQIARQVPNAKFVFISNYSRTVTRLFKSRLRRAFLDCGLEADGYCVFQPRLTLNDYLSLNLAADVMLDTPEWSGGKTALEAICCNLPIVTRPGAFMRGRHSYAMMKIMEIDETIAGVETEYIQTAVRLARDREFYRKIRQRTVLHKDRLFSDVAAAEALRNFFRSVVPVDSLNAVQEKDRP